jgi:hypothetical protein
MFPCGVRDNVYRRGGYKAVEGTAVSFQSSRRDCIFRVHRNLGRSPLVEFANDLLSIAVVTPVALGQFDRAKTGQRTGRFRKINHELYLDISGGAIAMLND